MNLFGEQNLFSLPNPAPAVAPSGKVLGRIPLRWCQREDIDAMMHAISSGRKKPACVAATGYGKGAEIAELVGRLRDNGKVLCLVDRAHLVHQLATEIERHLPEVSCGRIADSEANGLYNPIVVSTVQAMYTPDRSGRPLYAYQQFRHTKSVIADEAHKFFADSFRSVLEHFVNENNAVIPLFTATPVAANGARWASFVDWTPDAEGPCMRTTGWCVRNGYLVPPVQAFVRVNLRLDDIYGRLTSDEGEDEDRGDELADLLVSLLHDKSERAAATFASGIADVMAGRQSIIFSPRRIAAAKLIASWITATGRMRCKAVWGAMSDKDGVLSDFIDGAPDALANVDLLCEGYNNPYISAVFVCRLLKSWRLVNQMVGRALRPHPDIVDALNQLDEPDQAEQRRAVIASSPKPNALIADLVGLDERIIQASAIDVLHADEGQDVRAEMAEIILGRGSKPSEDAPTSDAEALAAAKERLRAKQDEQLAEMARRRGMAGKIKADVSVEYGAGTPSLPQAPAPITPATVGQKAMFVAVALQYDIDRAMGIATRTPQKNLVGMTFGMRKKLDASGRRPDWDRARLAYPEWANARKGEK